MNGQVHSLPLDLIEVGERLRPVDPDYVALIAASLEERGLDTPVTVTGAGADGRHRLIAGGHRMAAAVQLGWKRIDATIVEVDDLQAELREIDENLMRRELSALDRAVFLAKRKALWDALHPETRGRKAKGNKDLEKMGKLAPFSATFSRATAAKLGLDRSSIDRAIRRAALAEDRALHIALAGHPVADSGAELDKLLALPPDSRRAVVAALTRTEGPARSVAGALAEIAGPTPASRAAETQRQLAALMGAWRKAGRPARKQFLAFLASEGEVPANRKESTDA